MKVWIYIILAAILQTIWGVVLKILDFGAAWKLIKSGEVLDVQFLNQIVPLLLYFLLGLGIALIISKAYKLMTMSIVYASWMGLSLALQVLVDALYYRIAMVPTQYIYITLVLIGILGIKISNPSKIQEIDFDDSLD